MSVNKRWPRTPVVDAASWVDVVGADGWRVQYNQTLDALSPLKPYRLLDPGAVLWMSADTEAEMADLLAETICDYSERQPVFTDNHTSDALLKGLSLTLAALIPRLSRS